jgi:hypothetical protein
LCLRLIQTYVRKQDHLIAFSSLAAHNRCGSELCWRYMQEHWQDIEDLYGEHDSHLIHFVEVRVNVYTVYVNNEYSLVECVNIIR